MDFPLQQSTDSLTKVELDDLVSLIQSGEYQAEVLISLTAKGKKRQSYCSPIDSQQLEQLYYADIACANSEQGIILVDNNLQIVMVNDAFTEITAYSKDDVLGQNISILELEENDVLHPQHYKELIEAKKPYSGDFYSRKKCGDIYKQKLAIKPYLDEQGEHKFSVLSLSNMSEVMEQLVHFKHLSEVDTLTKLPNRTLLQKEFQLALALAKRNNKRLGLLYIDLNDFKPINDAHGHICGDEVLKVIANRMQSCIRETDTVSRIGGDEFILLIGNIDMKARGVCAAMSEKLKRLIAVPVECGSNAVHISASIGTAKYPDHGSTLEELLHEADQSMYENKRQSKQA